MNLMGKILTVLILLSSVVFLTLALIIGASHQNWYKKAEEFKKIAEARKAEKETILASSKENEIKLATEQQARALTISDLNARLANANTELTSKEEALNKAETTMATQTTQISQAQAAIKELDASIASLEKKNSDLIDQIAAIRVQVVALTNEKYALQGTKQDLEVRQKALSALNAKLTKVLRGNGLTITSLVDHIPPVVEGQVSKVAAEGYFLATIGNDDGLNKSHKLKVFRGEKYIGDADIVSVGDNRLMGRMIKDLQQEQLKEGDYVTTQR